MEVGKLDLWHIKYQGLEVLEVAPDDPEEWAPHGLWARMTKNGPVLQTMCLLRHRLLYHYGRLWLWCREAEAWETEIWICPQFWTPPSHSLYWHTHVLGEQGNQPPGGILVSVTCQICWNDTQYRIGLCWSLPQWIFKGPPLRGGNRQEGQCQWVVRNVFNSYLSEGN